MVTVLPHMIMVIKLIVQKPYLRTNYVESNLESNVESKIGI